MHRMQYRMNIMYTIYSIYSIVIDTCKLYTAVDTFELVSTDCDQPVGSHQWNHDDIIFFSLQIGHFANIVRALECQEMSRALPQSLEVIHSCDCDLLGCRVSLDLLLQQAHLKYQAKMFNMALFDPKASHIQDYLHQLDCTTAPLSQYWNKSSGTLIYKNILKAESPLVYIATMGTWTLDPQKPLETWIPQFDLNRLRILISRLDIFSFNILEKTSANRPSVSALLTQWNCLAMRYDVILRLNPFDA